MGQVESWLGNNDELADRALDHVAALIAEVQPGSMVQRFVLLVEVVDAEDRWTSAFCAPGQKAWDTLGLLAWADTLERQGHTPSDEEEDEP